jgi:hypothetical protein
LLNLFFFFLFHYFSPIPVFSGQVNNSTIKIFQIMTDSFI